LFLQLRNFLKQLKRFYHRHIAIPIKNLLPKSLYYRTILIISSTLLLVQIAAAVIFYDNYWRQIRGFLLRNLSNNIANIISQANETTSPQEVENVIERFRKYSTLNPQMLIINDPNNPMLQSNSRAFNLGKEIQAMLPNNPIYVKEYGADFSIIRLSVLVRDNIYITFYLEKDLFFIKSIAFFVIAAVMLYLLSLLIIVWFIRLQLRPINKLSKYAKQFGKGEKIPYIQPRGSIEIRETTIAFNEMTSQIQRFIEQRTMLLSSVSHDLKTSLTKMNLILDIHESPVNAELKEEVESMYQMISSYLSFARDDSVVYEKQYINIKEFFKSIIKNPNYGSMSINISFEQSHKIIEISPLLFRRAIDNILSNAIGFAKKIDITIKDLGNHNLKISIEDDGSGIPEEARELVFRPFYKVNEARTAKKGSVGLGLYIVKDIITKHGGNIELGDSQYGGLRVDITMPI
jgi:two-component system osmolarity sensor histidine kinase EnvZ